MVKLTILLLMLSVSACQTADVIQEKKPVKEYCGTGPAMYQKGLHTILMTKNEDLSFRDLGERDQLIFLNAYNRTPPYSDIKADRIRFYYRLGARRLFMVMSTNSCVSQAGPVNVYQIEAWLQGFVLDPSRFTEPKTGI